MAEARRDPRTRWLTNGYGPGLNTTMTDPMIIKHPLEDCVSFGNLSDLDLQGRLSLDLIMTMIGDLRFRKDRIEGTCARYFLLVDLSVIRSLCLSAHINCDKLRDYIQQFNCTETDESEPILDDPQTGFPFVIDHGSSTNGQNPLLETLLNAESDLKQVDIHADRGGGTTSLAKSPHEMPIYNLHGPASPQTTAPLMMSENRGMQSIKRQERRR